MFDLIINPIVTVMVFLYGLFGNQIVLSIAAVTVAIRLATSPLMISQQRSTKAMQEIQPELNKLREKYKNDREKMSQEQMRLFREHGINPLGGCLPLLVQMPILLALYRAINVALASTPFELIDLSDRLLFSGFDSAIPLNNIWLGMDLTLSPMQNLTPLTVSLPVLVAATTWLQSKLTMPSTPPADNEDGQPNQAAQMTRTMTTVMPLMFGFFSLNFSVGLSIYFFVSNLVGIVQYTLMGRAEWGNLLGGGEAPEKAKSSSNGKTKPDTVTEKPKQGKESKASAKSGKGKKASVKNSAQVEETLDEVPVPTHPSNRKDKRMKREQDGTQ